MLSSGNSQTRNLRRDGREEQDRQSGTGRRGGAAVRLHRLQLQQRVAEGPGRPPEGPAAQQTGRWREREEQEQREEET